MSLKDIGLITRKASGDDSLEESDSELVQNRKLKDKSYYAQSFQMFKESKSLVLCCMIRKSVKNVIFV